MESFFPAFMTSFLQKKLFAFLFLWPLLKMDWFYGFAIQSFVSIGYVSTWYIIIIDMNIDITFLCIRK